MKLFIDARNKNNSCQDYLPIEEHELQVEQTLESGTGNSNDPYLIRIFVKNSLSTSWNGVIRFSLHFIQKDVRFFLPAFLYGRNRGDFPITHKRKYPRIRPGDRLSPPFSSWWMVRSDRMSHPVVMAYDSGKIYALSASPYFIKKDNRILPWKPDLYVNKNDFFQYAGFSCALREETSLGYTIGYENAPWAVNSASDDNNQRATLEQNCFSLESGEEVEFIIKAYEYECVDPRGINEIIKNTYNEYHQSPRRKETPQQATKALAEAVHKDAWIEEKNYYAGFVFDKIENGKYSINELMSFSWTNGMAVALPQLLAGIRLNDDDMRERALSCIRTIMENCMNPSSGLPFDACSNGVWSTKGWWYDVLTNSGHSSYLVGEGVYYFLKGYDFEKRLKNTEHVDWLELAKNIIEKMENSKNTDFEYPYIWSDKTGAALEYDSFAGAWCLAAGCYYAVLSGDNSFLSGLVASEKHYYEAFVKKMECYGTPLDTEKAVDSEGILAYIRAVRWLHMLTHDDMYLQHLLDACHYEFTYKFCYNSPIKTPPLSRLGWSSCGGSVTSTSNPHIHPMSSTIIDELMYCYEHTKDSYIYSRMQDTVMWGCQTYNTFDNEYDYGKRGWMSERFCHSEGLLTQKYPDGSPASTWFTLMPWANASILEGYIGDFWDSEYIKML